MELYDVSYSGRVHEAMRAIVVRAQRAGLGFQVFEALRQLDRLLKVYPQFGQPLRDFVRSTSSWTFFCNSGQFTSDGSL